MTQGYGSSSAAEKFSVGKGARSPAGSRKFPRAGGCGFPGRELGEEAEGLNQKETMKARDRKREWERMKESSLVIGVERSLSKKKERCGVKV